MNKSKGRNIIADIASGKVEKNFYDNRSYNLSSGTAVGYDSLFEIVLKSTNIIGTIKNLSKAKKYNPNKPIRYYLNDLKNITGFSNEKISQDSNISRGYYQELLNGKKHASRDTVISLGFGFKLNLDEVNLLLKKAGYNELYMRDNRDIIIAKCVFDNETITITNQILDDFGLDILGK